LGFAPKRQTANDVEYGMVADCGKNGAISERNRDSMLDFANSFAE